jgi:hypothetical protein
MPKVKIIRVLRDNDSGLKRSDCSDGKTCPALAETEDGDFLIVGSPETDPEVLAQLPVGPNEGVIRVPGALLER